MTRPGKKRRGSCEGQYAALVSLRGLGEEVAIATFSPLSWSVSRGFYLLSQETRFGQFLDTGAKFDFGRRSFEVDGKHSVKISLKFLLISGVRDCTIKINFDVAI